MNTDACGLEIAQDKKFCNFCGTSQQPQDASAAKEILPVYPLKALRVPISELPQDVDPNQREQYLSQEEFEKAFTMDMAKFKRLNNDMKTRFRDFIFDDWRYFLPKTDLKLNCLK